MLIMGKNNENETTKNRIAYMRRPGLDLKRAFAVVRGPRNLGICGIKQTNETIIKSRRKVLKARLERETAACGRRRTVKMHKNMRF